MSSMPPQTPEATSRTDHRKKSKARQRQEARRSKTRHQGNARPTSGVSPPRPRPRARGRTGLGDLLDTAQASLRAFARNLSWSVVGGQIALLVVALVVLIVAFIIVATYAQGAVLPGVSVAGVYVGGLNESEAAGALRESWAEQSLILRDGEREWRVAPSELGFWLDATASARQAVQYGREGSGLSAMIRAALGGVELEPVIEFDMNAARSGLLRLDEEAAIPARNATIRLQGVVVTHIEAQNGRRVNVQPLLTALAANPARVIADGVINLPMLVVAPAVTDARPLVEFAQTLVGRPLVMEAYDPVADQAHSISVPPEQWSTWLDTRLEYHQTGPRLYLSLSTPEVRAFLEQQTQTLPPPLTLDIDDGIQAMQQAISDGSLTTWVTVRYLPTVHVVERGEFAYSISRSEGIPFYLIEQANPGRDLSQLSIGDEINLPSRDVTLPLRPVRGKRIVVDLSDQYMRAYQNGQVVYEWSVSTGIAEAPTSPGVFQILSHEELAYGSGFALCDDETLSCGQWVMHWFMGVYEAVPGLMNGFHGAVELPNGGYLGGGNVGRPYTYGCIMALESNAEQLYRWAEDGVVVEIRQ